MNCNKYSLLNYCGFVKAGPRKIFSPQWKKGCRPLG